MPNQKFFLTALIISPLLFFLFVFSAQAASLTFLPSSGTYSSGQQFFVDINMDTQSQNINLATLIINYNPSLFTVTVVPMTDPTRPSVFDSEFFNTNPPGSGLIRISRGMGEAFAVVNSSSARVAALSIIGTGSGTFDLDFRGQSDTDYTNVYIGAINAQDRATNPLVGTPALTSAIDGSYTITGGTDTTPPVRSSGAPTGTLVAGTTQATISLTTNESATCKYSTTAGTAYTSMANTFSTTGGTSHSSTITGLTNGSTRTYYVRCQDMATSPNANSDDFTISFSVASGADTTVPVVTAFTIPTTSASLTVSILTFTATDNVAVTGYKITESATAPGASDSGWSAILPSTYTVSSTGLKTLYAWAKDAAGNVSASRSASVTVTMTDNQIPTVTAFTIPSTATSLTVSITTFTATDNVAVTGYILTESATAPGASVSGWASAKPASYTFTSAGAKTLYAWAKDAAGNVSASRSASVTITLTTDTTAPTISSVSAASITSNSATIAWTTNEVADSQVEYGATASYGNSTTLNSSMLSSHSVLLSDLSPSTVYHYRVKSKDATGNLANSTDQTFTTTAASALSVTISASPSSGVAPLNNVSLTATVSGNVTGNINYTFYCNRADTGVNITTPNQGKYENQSLATYKASSICSYATAGTYTAKVIVERGTYQAEARATISVTQGQQANALPIGHVDGADVAHVFGWAYDKDAGSTPINVHVYIDGVPTANIVANLARPDLVTAKVSSDANHGFDYSFSPALAAGSHTIKIYAINTPEGLNPELAGSPIKINIGQSGQATLVKLSNDSKVYVVNSGKRRWIANAAVFSAGGYSWNDVQAVSVDQLNQYPEIRLIKASGDQKVYYITNGGLKRWIINENVFMSYGNRWEDIMEIPAQELNAYSNNALIHLDNDPRVYLITGTTKQWIKTAVVFNSRHYSWENVAPVNQTEFDVYQEGAVIQ